MDRATLRKELLGIAFLSFWLGTMAANALSRTGTFFDPGEPWWVLALGANLIFAAGYALFARMRGLLARLGAADGGRLPPVA